MYSYTPARYLYLIMLCLLCVGEVVMSHAAVDITEEFTDLNFRAAVYFSRHFTFIISLSF